ncbi:MAG TPA: hypothetical protein VMT92_01715 [Steroidobacteraceae bacterium]|nr:hypothetical protein [Steroidobacteraceae bacterium]
MPRHRGKGFARQALAAAALAACLSAAVRAQDNPVTASPPAPAEPSAVKPAVKPAAKPATKPATKAAPAAGHATHYQPDRFAGRAGKYYQLTWGIDSLSVKLVESGELVRFSYRVLDSARARTLNDKQNEASLIDPKAGVSLVVPTMEKIGQLRQSAAPEAGRSYWMAFSNKGRRVARGDRVDVVIGTFRASNLVVD